MKNLAAFTAVRRKTRRTPAVTAWRPAAAPPPRHEADPSRETQLGKLDALGTFLALEGELVARLCDVAAAAYRAGFAAGTSGGCASPHHGVLTARRHARAVLFPIFTTVTATAQAIVAALDDPPPTRPSEE